MRILFVSDSLIQFLIATHIRTTKYENDEVDLVMYDSMPMARKIYHNIKRTGIFCNCYLITSSLAVGASKLSNYEKFIKTIKWIEMLINPLRGTERSFSMKNYYYDEFVFCANGIFLDGLFNVCKKNNPNMKCYRYEGSLSSYLFDYENSKGRLRSKFESILKAICHRYDVSKCVDKYYFFEPDLIQFKSSYDIEKISKITTMKPEIISLLNSVFEFDNEKDIISEEYIAFEDGNLYFMNNNEEVGIFNKIANIVGKDNIVIKLHPRSAVNRFCKNNISVNSKIVPWEIFLLNQNMNGKTLITCASGSIFTTLLYFDINVKVVLLYKCIESKIPLLDSNFEALLFKLTEINSSKVIVPKSLEEIITVCKEEL